MLFICDVLPTYSNELKTIKNSVQCSTCSTSTEQPKMDDIMQAQSLKANTGKVPMFIKACTKLN